MVIDGPAAAPHSVWSSPAGSRGRRGHGVPPQYAVAPDTARERVIAWKPDAVREALAVRGPDAVREPVVPEPVAGAGRDSAVGRDPAVALRASPGHISPERTARTP
ncbi:hypothetical protein GCM10027187_39000 [Streptosporangium sandarakinum]